MKVLYKNNLRKSQSITVLIISKKKLSLIYYLKKKKKDLKKKFVAFPCWCIKIKKISKKTKQKNNQRWRDKTKQGTNPWMCILWSHESTQTVKHTHTTKNRTLSLALTNKLQKQKLDHENVVVLIVPYTRSTRVQHRYFFGS